MKKPATIIVTILLAVSVFGLAIAQSSVETADLKGKLNWHKYDEALKIAKEQDKYLLVFFTTNWCKFCKLMKKNTFTDPEVFQLMDEKFVLAQVYGDSKDVVSVAGKDGTMSELTETQLSRAFGIKGYPTTIFMKSDGTTIAPISGYWKPEQFEMALKFISSGAYENISFKDFAEKQKKG
jgi:thioredoxin-related protein